VTVIPLGIVQTHFKADAGHPPFPKPYAVKSTVFIAPHTRPHGQGLAQKVHFRQRNVPASVPGCGSGIGQIGFQRPGIAHVDPDINPAIACGVHRGHSNFIHETQFAQIAFGFIQKFGSENISFGKEQLFTNHIFPGVDVQTVHGPPQQSQGPDSAVDFRIAENIIADYFNFPHDQRPRII